MNLKKLTNLITGFTLLFLLPIVLTIGCKKNYDETGKRDYLAYSGTRSYVKDIIAQLSSIDTTMSMLSSYVKDDSIVWDKSALIGKIARTNVNMRCIVPYVDKTSNVQGYLKLGIDTLGKINKIEAVPDSKFQSRSESEKAEEVRMYGHFKSNGLQISSSRHSLHESFLSKTNINSLKPSNLRNSQTLSAQARCLTRFDIEVYADYWSCGSDRFYAFLYGIPNYVVLGLQAQGIPAQTSVDYFNILDRDPGEGMVNMLIGEILRSYFNRSEGGHLPPNYCNGGFGLDFSVVDYWSTCSRPETGGGWGGGNGYKNYNDISIEETVADETIDNELEIIGVTSKNPAKINYSAVLHCSAYIGSGGPLAIVESADMSMTVVNGSSTSYLPDGTEDTWYTTLANKIYSHSPYGLPTVTLTWNATKIVRHTVTKLGQEPVSKVTQGPIPPKSGVYSAYVP